MTYTPAHLLEDAPDTELDRDLSEPVAHHAEWPSFLKHQWDLFSWDPVDRLGVQAVLGGWGSGKTHAAARLAFRLGCMNPWTPAYGNSQPTGIIVSPTFKILKQSTLQQFDSLVPREAVLKRRGPPYNDITLANGFRYLLHSGEGEIEGVTACMVWVDEIAHRTFSSDGRKYLNLMARLRDPHSKRMGMIVSGLPESGWVRDNFDKKGPNVQTVLCATKDNPSIPRETLQQFFDSCPSGQEKTLLGGEWMSPIGAIYPQFTSDVHIVDREGRQDVPTHISFDIGNHGAIIFAQEIQVKIRNVVGQEDHGKGLLVCHQILTEDESVDQMCYRARTATNYMIHPDRSVICVDPTTRKDEILSIRRHFPGCRIVKRERGETDFFPVEAGIRDVQRALRDALGNVRLFFSKSLARTPLGVIDGLQRYRRNEKTNEPIKDNSRDHPLDALRYLVSETLQPDRPRMRVL